MATDGARLEIDSEQMRALGHRTIDAIVAHLSDLETLPASRSADASEITAAIGLGFDEAGADPDAVLDLVLHELLPRNAFPSHPRYFAFVPSPSNFVSILGDLLATAHNIWPAMWMTASAASEVERQCIRWMSSLCGLPKSAAGLFVSGGSMANLTALAAARSARLGGPDRDAIAYCSDQTHSSVARAMHILGFSEDQLCALSTGADLRLRPEAVERRLAFDRMSGRRPFLVVGSAGTTNTGAIDDLEGLATLCAAEDMWFHVDGAIGAAAALSASRRGLICGIDRADSITFDPHKWLFQPFDMGGVLLRDGAHLPACFRVLPDYLRDGDGQQDAVNFCDEGIELARRFRALKLWMSLRVFGVSAFRDAVERGMALGERAEQLLRSADEWELLSPAQLGIVTFRYVRGAAADDLDDLNSAIAQRIRDDGFAMVATTRIADRVALRLCINNPRTTEGDIEATLKRLADLGAEIGRAPVRGVLRAS